MPTTITYRFSGNCPYTGEQQTIKLEYSKILMVGFSDPGYKKGSYSCPHSAECPYPDRDPYGRCPVYLSSPDEPR